MLSQKKQGVSKQFYDANRMKEALSNSWPRLIFTGRRSFPESSAGSAATNVPVMQKQRVAAAKLKSPSASLIRLRRNIGERNVRNDCDRSRAKTVTRAAHTRQIFCTGSSAKCEPACKRFILRDWFPPFPRRHAAL